MRILIVLIPLLVYYGIMFIFANHMKKAAVLKGYGDDAHVWAMCFWLGILGALYAISLPDLVQQSQNQKMITAIGEKKNEEL